MYFLVYPPDTCIHFSQPLFGYVAVVCAESSAWKGSSWCKAENPRYKCQLRLSAFHSRDLPLPLLFSFITVGEKLSFLLILSHEYIFHLLEYNSLFLCSILNPSSFFPHSWISSWFSLSSHLSMLPREISTLYLFQSRTISASITLKSPRDLSRPLTCYLPPSPSPHSFYSPLCEITTRYNRRNNVPAERNRTDLRPESEKAIWANHTPPNWRRSGR